MKKINWQQLIKPIMVLSIIINFSFLIILFLFDNNYNLMTYKHPFYLSDSTFVLNNNQEYNSMTIINAENNVLDIASEYFLYELDTSEIFEYNIEVLKITNTYDKMRFRKDTNTLMYKFFDRLINRILPEYKNAIFKCKLEKLKEYKFNIGNVEVTAKKDKLLSIEGFKFERKYAEATVVRYYYFWYEQYMICEEKNFWLTNLVKNPQLSKDYETRLNTIEEKSAELSKQYIEFTKIITDSNLTEKDLKKIEAIAKTISKSK